MSLLNVALKYRDAGLSVIGLNARDRFEIKWTQYQEKLPTDEDLHYMFSRRNFKMLAIVCGAISGNIEVIDVDTKYDLTGTLWTRLWDKILDYYKGSPPFGLIQTPTGGMHLYYTCDEIGRNDELAKRPPEGNEKDPKVLIETRGEGGLIFAPPTDGYQLLNDFLPNKIPKISISEREDILSICREFNLLFQEEENPQVKRASVYKKTPWHEYNADDHYKTILISNGWVLTHSDAVRDFWRRPGKDTGHSASWHKEGRWFWIFSASTAFKSNSYIKPFDIYKTLQCDGDLSRAVREIKDLGFGCNFSTQEEGFISMLTGDFNNGLSLDEIMDLRSFDFESEFRNSRDVNLDQLVDAAKSRSIDGQDIFWIEDEKTGKLSLDKAALGDFLERRGYRLFVDNEDAEQFRLVHINYTSRIIQYVPLDKFRKDIERSLYQVEHKTSIRKLRNLIRSIADATLRTAIDFLPRIPLEEISFLKKAGNEKIQWFAFENGALRVDQDLPQVIPFDQLPAGIFVWKKDIKKFKIEILDIELEEEFNQSVIWKFFKRLAGITPDLEHLDHGTELHINHPDLTKRFFSIITSIGYLLSTYKNMDESFMPILEEDIESSQMGGGTGKGLMIDIVGFLRNVVKIDCKSWTPQRNFPFQKVKLDTDIIHFEDYDPTLFKIDALNNVITSGLDIENKYEGEFNIPYTQSPKTVMSSNYRTSDDSDFEARRQKKIYLSRYFNKQYRPAHEFKKEIGRGSKWTDFDQLISYNILVYCLQFYLKNGIIDFVPTTNVLRKSMIEEFKGSEILDYLDDFVKENAGLYVKLKEAHEEFLEQSGIEKRYFSLKRFRHALEVYAARFGYDLNCFKNNSRTIGDRLQFYFIFTEKGTVTIPFEAKCIKGHVF